MASVEDKLSKAKTQLILKHPFFGCLLLGCKLSEEKSIPTAATDGKDLFYNPDYIASLKVEEIQGLLAHEVGHKMYLHVFRKKERDHRLWNIAGDFAINIMIRDDGLILPAGALYDRQFDNMSTDAIYDMLLDKLKKQTENKSGDSDNNGKKQAPGSTGGGTVGFDDLDIKKYITDGEDIPDHLKAPGQLSEAEQSELEADIKTEIAQAASAAKQAGRLPESIARIVEKVLKPKVDWRKQLRDFLTETISGDITFQRPYRNWMIHDVYMPSETGLEMPPFALVFDTSGSIYGAKDTVETFVAEINGIIEDCSPSEVVVIYADSKVAHVQELEQNELLRPEIKGGGGTAFSESFNWIDKHDTDFAGIIYFTDLYVHDFGNSDIPTLWAVYDNENPQEPPFGTVIKIEETH